MPKPTRNELMEEVKRLRGVFEDLVFCLGGIADTIEEALDKQLAREVRAGRAAYRAGKGVSAERLMKKYGVK